MTTHEVKLILLNNTEISPNNITRKVKKTTASNKINMNWVYRFIAGNNRFENKNNNNILCYSLDYPALNEYIIKYSNKIKSNPNFLINRNLDRELTIIEQNIAKQINQDNDKFQIKLIIPTGYFIYNNETDIITCYLYYSI
tara:strand:- start:517 stop:939 length:423 start_codon:yes stop_codon:yes gene_type:complete